MQTEQALNWARHWLRDHNYKITAPDEMVRERPWSYVARFHTDRGMFYFKQTTPAFSIEARMMQFFARLGEWPVTKIIAHNDDLFCTLMPDDGTPLREQLAQNYRVDLSTEILFNYARLQQVCTPHTNELLAMGVPDWRLEHWPEFYAQLLHHAAAQGIPDSTIDVLSGLTDHVRDLCAELASHNIPETIEHNDFQDNNVLIDGSRLTINDWGETCITHPFFSLARWLTSAKWCHKISDEDPRHIAMRDSYLAAWQPVASMDKLRRAFDSAMRLNMLMYCLTSVRLSQSPGFLQNPDYQSHLLRGIDAFIAEQKA